MVNGIIGKIAGFFEWIVMERMDFDYTLPPELIAQTPAERRDGARMMVLNRAQNSRRHGFFTEITGLLRAGDLLVLNDTRVIPARLTGRRATGAELETLLVGELEPGVWTALVRKAGRIKPGEILTFENGALTATAVERREDKWVLKFDRPEEFRSRLHVLGRPPLPPYIHRDAGDRPEDRERYQTVYASKEGAVAAPTAGLHFTREILSALERQGVEIATVTLHVGEGTFKSVETERIADHKMHSEYYEVGEAAAESLRRARAEKRRVVAVGTTSARVLESLARGGEIRACRGTTGIFIYPGFSFQLTDALLTNFHLPKSTLLMLVSAFAGREWVLESYAEAVRAGYRFFSYGDCMWVE